MDTGFPSLTLFISKQPSILEKLAQIFRFFLKQHPYFLERAALEAELRRFQESLFNELGVIVPLIHLREDASLPANTYRLQMNDHTLDTVTGLELDEFWLLVPARQVVGTMWWGKTWQAREAVEPNTGDEAAIIHGDEAARRLWQDNGYNALSPRDYIVFTAGAVLRKYAAELLVPELVEHYMTKLRTRYPVLVDAVRQRFDIESLTGALRVKLAGRVSIKDLTGILENMLAESAAQ